MPESLLEGSCLCGGVRYRVRVDGPLEAMACCHRVQCRKASGAEFATNANAEAANFEFLAGEELLRGYEWSVGNERVFCGRSGSPILKRSAEHPERIQLRLGCVDTPIEQTPAVRVYLSEKAGWTEVLDSIPRLDTRPGEKSPR